MPQFDMRQIQQALAALVTLITLISAIVGLGNQLGVEGSSGSSNGTQSAQGARAVAVTQQELIDATNRFRVKHSVAPLTPSAELNTMAQEWSENMARTGEFEHRTGANVGENILRCQTTSDADALLKIWENSPGHRANMLNPDYTHIGVGIADNGKTRYATQNFR